MALLTWREAAKARWEKWFGQPWVGAATTVLGTLAGLYGAFNSSTLKAHFSLGLELPPRLVALIFCSLIVLFGSSLASILWAQSRRTKRAHEELSAANKELRWTVEDFHSLPSKEFLIKFQNLYYNVAQMTCMMTRDATSDVQQMEENIRTLLDMIISLVRSHHTDMADQDCRYAANIMLARNVRNLNDAEVTELKKMLKFCDAYQLDVKTLQYVLEVDRELSHASGTKEPTDRDPKLTHFALPVHVPNKREGSHESDPSNLVPGAPMTFHHREPRRYADQKQLIAETDNCNMTPTAKKEMNDFLNTEEGKQIQSFISLPLLWWRPEPEGAICLGVLNIRRDKAQMFSGHGFERFSLMICPFTFEIARIIEHMRVQGFPKYANRGI